MRPFDDEDLDIEELELRHNERLERRRDRCDHGPDCDCPEDLEETDSDLVAGSCTECGCDIDQDDVDANGGLCDECDWVRNGGAE